MMWSSHLEHGNSWQMEWCSYVQWSEASYHLSIHFQIIGYHLPVNYFNQSALSMILMWYIRRVTNRNIDDQQMISCTQNKLDKYLIVIVINSVIKWKIGLKRIIFCVWLFSVPRFHWLILIKTLDTFLSDIGNYFVYWFPFRLFECVWRESKVINLLQNFMIDVGDSCRIKIACKIMWI